MVMWQQRVQAFRNFLTLRCPQFHEANFLPLAPWQTAHGGEGQGDHVSRLHRLHGADVRLDADKIILMSDV